MTNKKRRTQTLPHAMPTQIQQATAAPLFSDQDRPDVVPLIEAIEKIRGSRVITYYLVDGAQMAPDALPSFYEQLRKIGKQDKIDLWIHSQGGATEMPWRLIQMVRYYCKSFGVLVTEVAQSAATHVSLGADEIVMGPFSLLSPVDPARLHPLLPKGIDLNNPTADDKPFAVSVQDLKHAVSFVKRESGEAGLTGEAYAQVISVLFEKVHPLAIGAIEQSYELSKLITRRMLSTHMDEKADAEEIERLTDALSDSFKSHGFPIGLLEAERLGLKVVRADEKLYDAMWALVKYYDNIDRTAQPAPANHSDLLGVRITGKPFTTTLGCIDSTDTRYDCSAILDIDGGAVELRGTKWNELTPASAPGATPAQSAPQTQGTP